MKFRRKPTEIEAIRYDGTNREAIADWVKSTSGGDARIRVYELTTATPAHLRIATRDEVYCAMPGDWVARDELGDLFVSGPDIFTATFDPAE